MIGTGKRNYNLFLLDNPCCVINVSKGCFGLSELLLRLMDVSDCYAE